MYGATWGDGKLMDEYVLGGLISPGTFFLANVIVARNKREGER